MGVGVLLVCAALAPLVLPAARAAATTDAVTTCAGSGAGSLPAVVQAAAAGDTVTFSVSCPPSGPITLSSTITIAKNLTITGTGPATQAVSGGDAVRDLSVTAGATVAISGLTIEDGLAPPGSGSCLCLGDVGGGVDNVGTLSLTNDVVSGNATANGVNDVTSVNNLGGFAGSGGGIFNGGTLTMTGTTVSGNTTGNGGSGGDNVKNGGSAGSAGGGGGIANDGTLTMTGGTVSANTTGNGGAGGSNDGPEGGDGGAGGPGGGITNSFELSLTDVIVTGNTTGTAGAGGTNDWSQGGETGSPGVGGGIDTGGSAVVTGSTVSDNSADGGGGIFSNGTGLHLSDSTVTGNAAGGLGGGGVDVQDNSSISDSTFTADTTTGAGGAIDAQAGTGVTITGSTLMGNGAAAGADLAEGDYLTVGSTIFADSTSGGDCTPIGSADGTDTIADDGTCFTGGANVERSTTLDATLGSLASNGGPTETVALAAGSPAIGFVSDPSLCTGPDQRAVPRPTPCDAGAYETATGVKAQAITFTSSAPTDAVVAGPSYDVTATGGGSGNPVTFSRSIFSGGVCVLSGSTVTFVGLGTCVIAADQFGGPGYAAAPEVQQSFAVGEGTPSFTSADTVSATVDVDLTFVVTTTGVPLPVITEKGKLPRGMSLHRENNGTARLTGRSLRTGTFPLTFKAVFGKGPTRTVVTQAFTLTVHAPPP